MEKPEDKDVKLFPFIDFNVVPEPESKTGKKYTFSLKTTKGGRYNMVLQAYSQEDFDEWMGAFKKFKDQLDDINNKASRVQ
jgi:hypothetical protein